MAKDTDTILCFIYKTYLERIKSGISKTQSNEFDDNIFASDKNLSSWNAEDIENCLIELHRQKLITRNIIGEFSLTTDALLQMENRFQNNLEKVLDILIKIFC